MTFGITRQQQEDIYSQQVLRESGNQLMELLSLEMQLQTAGDPRELAFSIPPILKTISERVNLLAQNELPISKAGQLKTDVNDCERISANIQSSLNKIHDAQALDIYNAANQFIKDQRTPLLTQSHIRRVFERFQKHIAELETVSLSATLDKTRKLIDTDMVKTISSGKPDSEDSSSSDLSTSIPIRRERLPANVWDRAFSQTGVNFLENTLSTKEETLRKDAEFARKLALSDSIYPSLGSDPDMRSSSSSSSSSSTSTSYSTLPFVPTRSFPSSSSSSISSSSSSTYSSFPALVTHFSPSSSSTSTSSVLDIPVSSSSLSSSVTPHPMGDKVFYASLRNPKPLASEQVSMHFLAEMMRTYTQLNLDAIIKMGGEVHAKLGNSVPSTLYYLKPSSSREQNDSYGIRTYTLSPSQESYTSLLTTLNSFRYGNTGGNLPIIGGIVEVFENSIAITIAEKYGKYVINIFCPNGNPQVLQGKPEAFRVEFSSLIDAAGFLAHFHQSLQNKTTKATMGIYVKAEWKGLERLHRNPNLSSSHILSSSSSSVSMMSPVMSLSGWPNFIDQDKSLIAIQLSALSNHPQDLSDALTRLKQIPGQLEVDIVGHKRPINMAALVLYHLHMIHRQETPEKIKKIPDYRSKAFLNQGGCSTTPLDRMRAIDWTRAFMLLYGLEQAYYIGAYDVADYYVRSINTLCEKMKENNPKDVVPSLEKIGYWSNPATSSFREDMVKQSFEIIEETRKAMKKAWKLP